MKLFKIGIRATHDHDHVDLYIVAENLSEAIDYFAIKTLHSRTDIHRAEMLAEHDDVFSTLIIAPE